MTDELGVTIWFCGMPVAFVCIACAMAYSNRLEPIKELRTHTASIAGWSGMFGFIWPITLACLFLVLVVGIIQTIIGDDDNG